MPEAATNSEDDDQAQNEHVLAGLKRACQIVLGAGVDTVQIIATRHDVDGTLRFNWGEGNAFARIASAEEWVRKTKRA